MTTNVFTVTRFINWAILALVVILGLTISGWFLVGYGVLLLASFGWVWYFYSKLPALNFIAEQVESTKLLAWRLILICFVPFRDCDELYYEGDFEGWFKALGRK